MTKVERQCLQCGACCLQQGTGWSPDRDDLRRWVQQSRTGILQYIRVCLGDDHTVRGDTLTLDQLSQITSSILWVHPVTGKPLRRCPFLRKTRNTTQFTCRIHDIKPKRCREYVAWRTVPDDRLYVQGYQCCKGLKQEVDSLFEIRGEGDFPEIGVLPIPDVEHR